MKLRTPLALAGAAAMAITTGLVTAATTSQAAATKSFAYGVSINGEGKQPYVESTDGSTQTQGTPPFPDNPLLTGTIAEISAGNDTASITIGDVTVGDVGSEVPTEITDQLAALKEACAPFQGQTEPLDAQVIGGVEDGLAEILPPALVPQVEDLDEFCTTILGFELPALADLDTLKVECNGGSGSVTLAGANILGESVVVPGNIQPNTRLISDSELAPLAALIDITLNRQTPRGDGSFSVDGAVISLGGGEGEIILGHTTCGQPIRRPAEGRAPVKKLAPQAEAPEPVRRSVPVTG